MVQYVGKETFVFPCRLGVINMSKWKKRKKTLAYTATQPKFIKTETKICQNEIYNGWQGAVINGLPRKNQIPNVSKSAAIQDCFIKSDTAIWRSERAHPTGKMHSLSNLPISLDHWTTQLDFKHVAHTLRLKKTRNFLFLRLLRQMLADFHNSFTAWLVRKFAITFALNIPPHLTNVATLPCETLMSENSDNLKHV